MKNIEISEEVLLKLMENSGVILLSIVGLLLIIGITLAVIAFFFRDRILQKLSEKYFEEELLNQFRGFKSEYLELLSDVSLQNRFKENSKILILNDVDNIIKKSINLSNFKQPTFKYTNDEVEELNEYAMVILYLKDNPNEKIVEYKDILNALDKNRVLLLTYCECMVDRRKLKENEIVLPKNNVFANSQFTLIEYLHSAYLIKKIVES